MKKLSWKAIYMLGGGVVFLAALFLAFSLGMSYGRKNADPVSINNTPGDGEMSLPGQDSGEVCGEDAQSEAEPFFEPFTAQTLDGKTVTDADLACGKISLVNCFGTFCGPCIEEMPDLERLSGELTQVSFFGVCTDLYGYDGTLDKAQLDTAGDIVSTCGVTYPVIIPPPNLQESVFDDIVALPCTYILSGEGELLETVMGRQTYEAWRNILEKY